MSKIICRICGQEDESEHWSNGQVMAERHLCQECNFWQDCLNNDKNRRWAVINGEHYVLEPHTDDYFKGFGGKEYTIRFFDGTIVKCDNLWHQGEIPDGYWREQFPDNAEFIPTPVGPVPDYEL